MRSLQADAKCGKIQGVYEDGCVVFKGIPYAKAPVGELRFKAPVAMEPWDGVYMADHYGNRSAQEEFMDERTVYPKEFYQDKVYATPISEDSLFLNIWVPEKEYDHPLPVAFYIHGGAFMGGTGHEVEFRSTAYAKKDVILVTINYRLGILGFLAHPWLYEEDPVACGNVGILDQIAALTWVQENISAFGGDPDNVTIFGQSAGCMSVQTLLSTPLAKGKFSKAIMQSGAGYPVVIQKNIPLEDAFAFGKRVVEEAGVNSLEELRALQLEKIFAIQGKIMMEVMMSGFGLVFSPVHNPAFRPDTYDNMTKNGQTIDVPTMLGTTKNDIMVTEEEVKAQDSRMQQACRGWALEMEKNGHQPAYVYYFKRDLPGDNWGAFHSAELWYTFGTLGSCWRPMTEGDYALSERMVSYWTNFMKNGTPDGEGLETWPPYTKENPFEMIFDI